MEPTKARLYQRFLTHAPFDGWGGEAFVRAYQDLALSQSEASKIFFNIPEDLILYQQALESDFIAQTLPAILQNKQLKFHQKITEVFMVVYLENQAIRPALAQMVGWLMQPQNQKFALSLLLKRVDFIWKSFGDRSLDWNYYSKRGLLAGVLLSTLPVYLNDKSQDLSHTRQFLENRIDNVMTIPKIKSNLQDSFRGGRDNLAKIIKSLSPHGFSKSKPSLRMRGD